MLHPTPPELLCDPQGRPYFLWDVDLTLQQLRMLLADPDEDVRAYWMGKVLRQAKPDDALTLMDIEQCTHGFADASAGWRRCGRGSSSTGRPMDSKLTPLQQRVLDALSGPTVGLTPELLKFRDELIARLQR